MEETVTTGAVAAYLRERLPQASELVVEELFRNVGGMSRQTWFAHAAWTENGSKQDRDFTLRLDHPEGSVVPVPLEYEYQVYAALAGTRVPVAKALWWENDESWLGRPFYVRETIEGSSSPKEIYLAEEDEFRASIGRQLAELLARVHTLDWRKQGFASFMEVPPSRQDCALSELRRWEEHFRANPVEPKPVMAALFSWLKRNAPTSDRISLVWGDVGMGNFIFRDGRIVGLTDWEQAHLGDPMKDWAFGLWRGIENLLPKDELFSVYEDSSGIAIDEDRIRYYTAFINTQNACTSHPVLGRFAETSDIDISLVRLGMGFPFDCQDQGLRITGY
jgi:aminoglycoside phosphotransferase (APT) family kinase protein